MRDPVLDLQRVIMLLVQLMIVTTTLLHTIQAMQQMQ